METLAYPSLPLMAGPQLISRLLVRPSCLRSEYTLGCERNPFPYTCHLCTPFRWAGSCRHRTRGSHRTSCCSERSCRCNLNPPRNRAWRNKGLRLWQARYLALLFNSAKTRFFLFEFWPSSASTNFHHSCTFGFDSKYYQSVRPF